MTERTRQDDAPRADANVGEAFKREGPTPATEDTGETVEEMNREAEKSFTRNIRPEDADR